MGVPETALWAAAALVERARQAREGSAAAAAANRRVSAVLGAQA